MESIIPIYILEQFAETDNFELLNKDLISRKVDPGSIDCIELNFPAKINSFSLLLFLIIKKIMTTLKINTQKII